MNPDDDPRFVELVSSYLDAALSPQQEAQLLEVLQETHYQRRFLELVRVHAEVAGLLAAPVSDDVMAAFVMQDLAGPPAEAAAGAVVLPPLIAPPAGGGVLRAGPPYHSRWSRLRGRAWWLAGVAAALLIGAGLGRVYVARPTVSPPPAVEDAPVLVGQGDVAVLTRAVNAEWETTPLPTSVGSALVPGRLKLKSGLVQLELYGGAILILEGPADFELLGTDRGFCRAGKLRAKVSPQSRGFTISTATVDLVDLGTEFGLHVDPKGGGEVQVFDGKVELHRKDAGQAPARQEVISGQAVRLDAAGASRPTVARPEAFVGVAELERRSLADWQQRYRAWQAASRTLQADPRLVLYCNFEGQQRWSRTVRYQGPPGRRDLDGAIVGCQWIEGRWPGKAALEFKRIGDRVRMSVPGTYDAMTWMAWVRIDGLERRYTALFLTDGFEEGAAHWQFTDKGEMMLGIKGSGGFHNFVSPVVLGRDQVGQWIHLATVYDHRAQGAIHYVNGQPVQSETVTYYMDQAGGVVTPQLKGQPVGSQTIRFDSPLRLGNAELGNWGVPLAGPHHPLRTFNGRMDEFALFGQALSSAEIQRLYENGKPN